MLLNIAISEETASGRGPDVVIIILMSQSGQIGRTRFGALSGNFTDLSCIGPLEGKTLADFVKAINDGKLFLRVSTTGFSIRT